MKPRDLLARGNRLQKSLPFKVAASAVVVVLMIAAFVTYLVVSQPAPGAPDADAPIAAAAPGESAPAPAAQAVDPETARKMAEAKTAFQSAQQIMQELATARRSPSSVAVGLLLAGGVALIVVWLGLALTYLALMALAAGIAWPLSLSSATRDYATLLLGVVALAASFTALVAALKAVLSDNPVSEFLGALIKPFTGSSDESKRSLALPMDSSVRGIATKTIIEALRMKVSVIFIVVLIFALAALPMLLSPETPLRYRVQSFLQWGTGGSYWLIAILTLFFGVGSVAFEQRDRQIWQTMTKPVSSAQYILGKWLGLIGLNAVLLAVCCTGVFLFTEYLRNQPAVGEAGRESVMAAKGAMTEDRFILESQILQARTAVEPEIELRRDNPEFLDAVRGYIEDGQKRDPEFGKDQATYDRIMSDLYTTSLNATRAIAPGQRRQFVFKGLGEAKRENKLLLLRYRIDAGSNRPDVLYKLTFVFGGYPTPPQSVGLGPTHTFQLYPQVIDDKGELTVEVFNAAVVPQQGGAALVTPNAETCIFPRGGLEISYSAGSFQMNFFRVVCVLWVKLAFLAMLAVTAATFLSFPVACLVAFSVFLAAEGSGFLSSSLEYYDAVDEQQKVEYWKVVIRAVGLSVSWMFKNYAQLKPTTKLVDGRILGWGDVAWGGMVLIAWTSALYAIAVQIFKKRELATYSGQ